MLFSTQLFLLVFLPLSLAGYYALAQWDLPRAVLARRYLLIAASLWFYGYWDPRLLPLLLGSIVVNWLFAKLYGPTRRHVVLIGVALNLLLLGIFKYADFFADTIALVAGNEREPWGIVLPLAISFFTFQQISYLVDRARGKARAYGLTEYTLYVSFFPQLIAGPIVRHHELIKQFDLSPLRDGLGERMGQGLALLVIGLVKKVFVADSLAVTANRYFAWAAQGESLGFAESWLATLTYTFQLYFDFSSYSDMALGMGLMFGFVLPLNFDSPYQARSIRDFWRRWHMTLTRFFRDYVYVPVGRRIPKRYRRTRESVTTLVTMGLIGLWHGAAWSYVLFGLVHGAALVINQLWIDGGRKLNDTLAWWFTFSFFAISLVLFRSEDLAVSITMWTTMFTSLGMDLRDFEFDDGLVLVIAAVVAFGCPNAQTLVRERISAHRWVATALGLALAAVLLGIGAGRNAEFIYFQF